MCAVVRRMLQDPASEVAQQAGLHLGLAFRPAWPVPTRRSMLDPDAFGRHLQLDHFFIVRHGTVDDLGRTLLPRWQITRRHVLSLCRDNVDACAAKTVHLTRCLWRRRGVHDGARCPGFGRWAKWMVGLSVNGNRGPVNRIVCSACNAS